MKRSVLITFVSAFYASSALSQIGETKDELSKRYGTCSPDRGPTSRGPNVYDGVLDVGDICYFHHDGFYISALFKGGKAQAFFYNKMSPPALKSYPYAELTDGDIASFLRAADSHAEWISLPSEAPLRRWRTTDSSIFAYYFSGGHRDRYTLIVQTAAVDAVYRRVKKD